MTWHCMHTKHLDFCSQLVNQINDKNRLFSIHERHLLHNNKKTKLLTKTINFDICSYGNRIISNRYRTTKLSFLERYIYAKQHKSFEIAHLIQQTEWNHLHVWFLLISQFMAMVTASFLTFTNLYPNIKVDDCAGDCNLSTLT